MSGAARKFDQDYWQPPRSTEMSAIDYGVPAPSRTLACSACGSEFVVGARFCHVCGGERTLAGERERNFLDWLDFSRIRQSIGLPIASLVCFGLGAACVVAAIVTGLIYTATTVLDWQAVQIWRIEWLLASMVALVAGILLKNGSSQ
ncbi:MAG: hypothetical protein ACRD3E_03845 [Terriglobales bacterium]